MGLFSFLTYNPSYDETYKKMIRVADQYFNMGYYSKAFSMVKEVNDINKHFTYTYYIMAHCYLLGIGTTQNIKMVEKLLANRTWDDEAAKNDVRAMMYALGIGVPQDMQKAESLMANEGKTETLLAIFYATGVGSIPQNVEKALKCNFVSIQLAETFGDCFAQGKGTKAEPAVARRFYQMALKWLEDTEAFRLKAREQYVTDKQNQLRSKMQSC